jgi:transposase
MARPPAKSPEEKERIVLAILRDELTVAEAARREGVSGTTLAKWRDQFLDGGRSALAAPSRGPSSREAQLEAEVEQLNAALGEAHMELRVWKKGGLGR